MLIENSPDLYINHFVICSLLLLPTGRNLVQVYDFLFKFGQSNPGGPVEKLDRTRRPVVVVEKFWRDFLTWILAWCILAHGRTIPSWLERDPRVNTGNSKQELLC